MTNVAFNKRIEEVDVVNAQFATDGVVTGYTEFTGYAHFPWPGTCTVDIESAVEVHSIRFLLWDGLGNGGKRSGREYKYRLLVSLDREMWHVLFDESGLSTNGWQEFTLATPMLMRYVRLHGLWNSANEAVHVVELEVHDATPPELGAEVRVRRTVGRPPAIEIGDGSPIAERLRGLLDQIDRQVADSLVVRSEPFHDLTSQLRRQLADVSALEKSLDAVRREIVQPVQKELHLSNKIGRFSVWGFWVGLVGGMLAIVSFLYTLLCASC